jgi:hypothetical protein
VNEQLAAALAGWHDFFAAATGAGAVLLGLVFIGLTIHLGEHKEKPALVPLAVTGAVTLFYPVVIGLLMLMPVAQPLVPSILLAVIALFAILSAGAPIFDRQLRQLWAPRRRLSDWFRHGVPWLASLALLGLAGLLLVEPTAALYGTALIIVIYLVIGTQNAWNMLLAGRFDVTAWTVTWADREPPTDDDQSKS